MNNLAIVESNDVDLERVLSLLQLVFEELNELPREDDTEKAVKLAYFCKRQALLEALLFSAFTTLKQVHKANEQLIQHMINKNKMSEVA